VCARGQSGDVAWRQRGCVRAHCATRWCAMMRRDCRSCWEPRRPARAARRRRRASTCRWSRPGPRTCPVSTGGGVTRRVRLVRREGRDVSTLYGREGRGGGKRARELPCRAATLCGLSAMRCPPQRPLSQPALVRSRPPLFVLTNPPLTLCSHERAGVRARGDGAAGRLPGGPQRRGGRAARGGRPAVHA